MIDITYWRDQVEEASTCRRCEELRGLLFNLTPDGSEEYRKWKMLIMAVERKHDYWKTNPTDQHEDDFKIKQYSRPTESLSEEEKEEREKRNAYQREWLRKRLENETPEQRQRRLDSQKRYRAKKKLNESNKHRRRRLSKKREYVKDRYHTNEEYRTTQIEKKKERYKNDPVYREACKARARISYLRKKERQCA